MKVSRDARHPQSALSLVLLVASSAATFTACSSGGSSGDDDGGTMGDVLDSGSPTNDAGSGGDGDTTIDAGTCAPGATESCYGGAANTAGVGACVSGTRTCLPDGSGFGDCQGQVVPVAETCATLLDDDCDSEVNEGCACTPGSTMACYGGPEANSGVGECTLGTATCNADGSGFGECLGYVSPASETCETPGDEDCDGDTNEEGVGCVCIPDEAEPCYDGPEGTRGVGACSDGTATCNALGTELGACADAHKPAAAENCADLIDDDCDDDLYNGCVYSSCAALPDGSTSGIYTLDIDSEGPLAPLPFFCDMETDGGGWRMVFKVTAGVSGDADTLWNGGATNDTTTALLNTSTSTEHYVSRTIADAWTDITEARLHVYDDTGAQQVFAKFDAEGSTATNWFASERLTGSSWTDLGTTLAPNYFAIAGDPANGRRFFINHTYGGCENDSGWLVLDSKSEPCAWELPDVAGEEIKIIYGSEGTVANWTTGSVGRGKVFAVFVK